jgi:hypothetical protein
LTATIAGSQAITGKLYGGFFESAVSISAPGSLAEIIGGWFSVSMTGSGPVTTAYGGRFFVSVTASANVTTAHGILVETPVASGTLSTYYGVRVNAGAGSAIYGIAQIGTADLNYFAGYTAFGSVSPVTSTFALFGASTATVSSMRIVAGTAAYAGTVEGDFWNDYTQKCLIGHIDGLKQYDSRVCFVQTADKTITNTNVETTCFGTGIGSLTFPADFFVVGKTLRITLRGTRTCDPSPPDYTFRVKLGGVTWASHACTDVNESNRYFELSFILTCRTTGAGGTGIGQGFIWTANGSSGGIILGELVMTATGAMNTTGSLAIDVTCQPSVADAGTSLTFTNPLVEIIA